MTLTIQSECDFERGGATKKFVVNEYATGWSCSDGRVKGSSTQPRVCGPFPAQC